MNLKIKFNKEIHIFKGSQNFQEISEYIKTAFKNLPSIYSLYYEDEDGDEITVSCTQDIESMVECNEKLPKLIIKEVSQQASSDEQQQQQQTQEEESKKDEKPQQQQQEQQQQSSNNSGFEDLLGNLMGMAGPFLQNLGQQQQQWGQQGQGCEFFTKMAEQFGQQKPKFEEMAKEFSKMGFGGCNFQQGQGQQGEFFQNLADQMNNLGPYMEEMAQQFQNPEFFTAAFMPQQQSQQQQPQQQQQENDEQVKEQNDEDEINQFLSKGPKEDSEQTQQKEKVLKEFDEETLLKACQVSEILGGDINEYLGVCEAYRERELDYIINRLAIDPKLTEKFSSYQ